MSLKNKDVSIIIGGQTVVCKAKDSFNIYISIGMKRNIINSYLRQLQYKAKIEGLDDDEKYDKQECLEELSKLNKFK